MPKKTPNTQRLYTLAAELSAGPGDPTYIRRRTFELAHRAHRRLELVAETASRGRWALLAEHRDMPRHSAMDTIPGEMHFAFEIAREAFDYPVRGEAAVYAALLDAVDLAASVSEQLYQQWLKHIRDSKPLPLPEPGINKIGAPLASGCCRRESCVQSDEDLSS